jgi:hypothetical protein
VQVGERLYFFVCNFTNPISATITQSDGVTQPVQLLTPTSNRLPPTPYFNPSNALKAVIDWSALPTLTVTGRYTLTVLEADSPQPPVIRPFGVRPPTKPHILIRPPSDLSEMNFMIYYVNFTPSLTLTFDLYSQGQSGSGEDSQTLYDRSDLQVSIIHTLSITASNGGWGRQTLRLTGPPGIYAIGYEGEEPEDIRQPEWLFWLR